jgi:large subunit ribosomal protein L32
MRRAHDFLTPNHAIQECPNCGALMQRHHVCPSCNFYRGRAVFPDADTGAPSTDSST